MNKSINWYEMPDDEIAEQIRKTGFGLYGNFSVEKRKLVKLFGGDADILGVEDKESSNKLTIRIWNPKARSESDVMYRIFEYRY